MSKALHILVLVLAFAPSLATAQITLFGFDAQTGSPLPICVKMASGVERCATETDKGLITLTFEGEHEILVTCDGYQDFRKTINGNVASRHNIALFRQENIIEGVVVTDIHRKRSLPNTVLNISLIDAKRIESMGAMDLRDALAFENNIRLNRDNALGSTSLSLMGIGGENVKLLVDGVPVIGRMLNQVDLEQFNLENTQQIEVVQGPMSVIFGSNALAGSINIITANTKKGKRLSLTSNYETDGQYNLSGTASRSFGNHYVTLSGGRLFFDGWSEQDVDRTFDWLPKEQYNARAQYAYRHGDARISIRSEYMRSRLLNRGTPIQPYGESAIDQWYRNRRYDNSLSYENKIGESSIQLMLSNNSFKRIKNKYYKDLVTLDEFLVALPSEQDTQRFNASVMRAIYGFERYGIETLTGLDANYEFGTGGRILNNWQDQLDVALFTSAEKQLTSFLLARVGLRYAYNSSYNTPLLYSAQTKFNFRKSRTLKLAYGKGFRSPSLKELYLDFNDASHEVFGNDQLLPETSHSLTSTYTKYYRYKKIQFSTEINGFYNSIRNKIDLLVAGPIQAQYGNIGLFRSVGGGLGQKVTYGQLKLNASYTHTGTFNGLGDEQNIKYNFSPQIVVSPNYTIKKTNTAVSVFYNYVGKVNRVFTDTAENTTTVRIQQAYSMMDLTVSQPLLKNNLRVTAGVRNLFGVVNISTQTQTGSHASSNSVSISPGRTYFISIKYEFKK